MKNLKYIVLAGLTIPLMAADCGTDGTGDTTGLIDCMVDADGDQRFDVYPDTGPLSAGDYTNCEDYTGQVLISYFPKPTCAGDQWDYVIETQGWASGGLLYSLDTGGGNTDPTFWWDETHDFTQGQSNSAFFWDQYTLTLPVTDDFNQQEANTNSFHACVTNNDTTLVWGIELFDYDNQNDVVDCIIVSGSETTDGYVDELKTTFGNLSGCDSFRWTAE